MQFRLKHMYKVVKLKLCNPITFKLSLIRIYKCVKITTTTTGTKTKYPKFQKFQMIETEPDTGISNLGLQNKSLIHQ